MTLAPTFDGSTLVQGATSNLVVVIITFVAMAARVISPGTAEAGEESVARIHVVATFKGHDGGVCGLAFFKPGQSLFSCGEDATVRMWDIDKKRPASILRGHVGEVYGITLTRSGDRLITGGQDGVLRQWDVAVGREVARIDLNRGAITSVVNLQEGTVAVTHVESGDVISVRLSDGMQGRLLPGDRRD